MAIDISQFFQVFFEESQEHLDDMEQLLLKLNANNPDFDQLNAIFRAAHSIKGGSATFGFNDMTAVTHVMESLLDRIRKKTLPLQTIMVDVFLQATDVLKMQLNGHINGTPAAPAIAEAISHKLNALSADIAVMQPAPMSAEDSFGFFDDADSAKPASSGDDGFGFFEAIETKTSKPKNLKKTKPKPVANADDGFGFFEPLKKSTAKAKPKTTPEAAPKLVVIERRQTERGDTESSSIRVSVEKVDQLINLVGELVITQAMLAQSASHDTNLYAKLNTGMAQLERNTRDLQESVMSIRMMPISYVFGRFPRLVRDLASTLNKQVELVTLGENTELDKGLIEKIGDPLTHLIRNSLDHGIELPAARIKAGKPALGSITLSASHQGGSILIEVSDDGAGLNRQRILSTASQRGLPVSDEMTDAQVWELIFAPGFSTAEVITDVSGRGVGMDVVKRNIGDMGGEVGIDSRAGEGTIISIRLPLTLAILEGMSVALGRNLYVIPLNLILETMQPKPEQLKTVTGEGALVQVHGEYIPIIALHSLFNMPTEVTNPCDGILVLIEAQGKKAALFVDALVGQQQVVIKSMETNFRKVAGVSGATIMGDGSVALIIDVAAIIKLGQKTNLSSISRKETA
jgi:two-component system, chemotaxis family, sensor kinase CheA